MPNQVYSAEPQVTVSQETTGSVEVLIENGETVVEITQDEPTEISIVAEGAQGPKGDAGQTGQPGANADDFESHDFSMPGNLVIKTGTARVYFESASIVQTVRASVSTAPTGQPVIVDMNRNNSTLFTDQSARLTILAGTNTATSAPNVTTFASGDYVTVDIDQVGNLQPGSDLTVTLRVRNVS